MEAFRFSYTVGHTCTMLLLVQMLAVLAVPDRHSSSILQSSMLEPSHANWHTWHYINAMTSGMTVCCIACTISMYSNKNWNRSRVDRLNTAQHITTEHQWRLVKWKPAWQTKNRKQWKEKKATRKRKEKDYYGASQQNVSCRFGRIRNWAHHSAWLPKNRRTTWNFLCSDCHNATVTYHGPSGNMAKRSKPTSYTSEYWQSTRLCGMFDDEESRFTSRRRVSHRCRTLLCVKNSAFDIELQRCCDVECSLIPRFQTAIAPRLRINNLKFSQQPVWLNCVQFVE